jgi:hypothetical protein
VQASRHATRCGAGASGARPAQISATIASATPITIEAMGQKLKDAHVFETLKHVTVVTHGFQLTAGSGDSLLPLAEAVALIGAIATQPTFPAAEWARGFTIPSSPPSPLRRLRRLSPRRFRFSWLAPVPFQGAPSSSALQT